MAMPASRAGRPEQTRSHGTCVSASAARRRENQDQAALGNGLDRGSWLRQLQLRVLISDVDGARPRLCRRLLQDPDDRHAREVGDSESGGRQGWQGDSVWRGGPKWATTRRSTGGTMVTGHRPAEESSGTACSTRVSTRVASDRSGAWLAPMTGEGRRWCTLLRQQGRRSYGSALGDPGMATAALVQRAGLRVVAA
jgi:hypothetical protein